MFCKKSIFKLLSLGILFCCFSNCESFNSLRGQGKDKNSEDCYCTFVCVGDKQFDGTNIESLGSPFINTQFENQKWELFQTNNYDNNKQNWHRKIVTLPASLGALEACEICTLIPSIHRWDNTSNKWISDYTGAANRFIEQAYKTSYLIKGIRMVKTLEILKCPKLLKAFNAEIEQHKKEDAQFASRWNTAIKKYEFQRTANVKTQTTATTLVTCKKENHIPGNHAIWSADGQYLAISQQKILAGFETKIWNAKTNTFKGSFNGAAVSFSPNGTKLISMCFDCPENIGKVTAPIKIYDINHNCELHTFSGYLAQFIENGKQLAVIESGVSEVNGAIKTYRIRDWKNTTPKDVPPFISGQFSPDGTKFLTAITCAYFGVYDFTTGKSFYCLGRAGGFSANSRAVATCGRWYGDRLTNTYDVEHGTQTGEFIGNFAAFSSNAQRVAVVTEDPAHKGKPLTSIYDIETGKKLHTFSGDLQQFMPNNDDYALVLDEKMVCLRNYVTGQNVLKANATSGMFSPNGAHLFLLENGTVSIYSISKK